GRAAGAWPWRAGRAAGLRAGAATIPLDQHDPGAAVQPVRAGNGARGAGGMDALRDAAVFALRRAAHSRTRSPDQPDQGGAAGDRLRAGRVRQPVELLRRHGYGRADGAGGLFQVLRHAAAGRRADNHTAGGLGAVVAGCGTLPAWAPRYSRLRAV